MKIVIKIEHAGDGNHCVCFRRRVVDVPPLAELGGEGGKSKTHHLLPLATDRLANGFHQEHDHNMREADFTRRLARALASQLPQTAKGDFGLSRRYALRMVATRLFSGF